MIRKNHGLPRSFHPRQGVRSRAALICAILLAAALLIRLMLIASKLTMEHDEAISYLAASGHLRNYAIAAGSDRPPAGEWVPAREWQRFMQPDRALIFRLIFRDLANYDTHPPLYFWMLHSWILIVETTLWAGPLLNLLFDLGTALVLYRLARIGTPGGPPAALAVVAVWALSPVSLMTMAIARPYALFALMTVGYALALRSAVESLSRLKPWFALTLIGAAGLLTHYYFVLVLLAGGIVILSRRDRRRLYAFLGCSASSLIGLAVLHPDFRVLVRQETGCGFAWSAFSSRLESVCGAGLLLLIPLAAALILPFIAAAVWRVEREAPPGKSDPAGPDPDLIFLGCLLGGPVVLHLAQISPAHVMMEYRYFAPAWPFAVLLIVRLLETRGFTRLGEAPYVLACLGMLALAVTLFRPDNKEYGKPAPGTRVLIDDTARGVLLPLVFHLDGETLVYASEPDDLLAAPDRWLPPLTRDGGLYSQFPGVTSDPADRDSVLTLIAASARITEPLTPYVWQANFRRSDEQVYEINPLASP